MSAPGGLLGRVLRVRARTRRQLVGTFGSHVDALGSLRDSAYEAEDVVELVCTKTRAVAALADSSTTSDWSSAALLAAVLRARSRLGRAVRVREIGGGAGAHFLHLRHALGADFVCAWEVIETPTLVRAAVTNALDPRLSFRTGARGLAAADVLLAHNALQYLPDPVGFVRSQLDGPLVACLSRVAGHAGRKLVFSVQRSRLVDNGPGPAPMETIDREVRYPVALVPHADWDAVFAGPMQRLGRWEHPDLMFHRDVGYVTYRTDLLEAR